jgi:hypothetical protein
MDTVYLLPLTGLSLLLTVGALGLRANRRHGYSPLGMGVVAALALVCAKFILDSNITVYGAIAALVGASLWNSWPRRLKSVSIAPPETLCQIGSIEKEI